MKRMEASMAVRQHEEAKMSGSDKRGVVHRRLERWVRLQQFVYGLPDDYTYAVCTRASGDQFVGKSLVKVGWMTWFGEGRGPDRQHAIAISLLETTDAVTASSYRMLWHAARRWVRRLSGRLSVGQRAQVISVAKDVVEQSEQRLAG